MKTLRSRPINAFWKVLQDLKPVPGNDPSGRDPVALLDKQPVAL